MVDEEGNLSLDFSPSPSHLQIANMLNGTRRREDSDDEGDTSYTEGSEQQRMRTASGQGDLNHYVRFLALLLPLPSSKADLSLTNIGHIRATEFHPSITSPSIPFFPLSIRFPLRRQPRCWSIRSRRSNRIDIPFISSSFPPSGNRPWVLPPSRTRVRFTESDSARLGRGGEIGRIGGICQGLRGTNSAQPTERRGSDGMDLDCWKKARMGRDSSECGYPLERYPR